MTGAVAQMEETAQMGSLCPQSAGVQVRALPVPTSSDANWMKE
jgi:hypothetical protein